MLRHYPHQFSGGMRAAHHDRYGACLPARNCLIADEATTALDVTVQKDILDLLQRIQHERQMAMILVTHNLGVVVGRTDEIMVLYGGRVVEHGPTRAGLLPAPAIATQRRYCRRCRAWTSPPIPAARHSGPAAGSSWIHPPDARSRRAARRRRDAAIGLCRR